MAPVTPISNGSGRLEHLRGNYEDTNTSAGDNGGLVGVFPQDLDMYTLVQGHVRQTLGRAADGVPANCRLGPRCGDSQVNGPEQCDDGNTRSGDGCSSVCRWEAGVAR